ncbi:MAG: M48 family metalloprotease [Candidatus Omnitrophica bacterium]|nr:M48 family metalloprotease [Candidatus Omnitrophota bacterium]
MFALHTRMFLLIAALFAIVYAVMVMVGISIGVGSFYTYLVMAIGMMFFQYMIGPKIIEWSSQVKYIKREDNPKLFGMVEDLARRANMPMPRVCISPMAIPNAFAFGRGIRDGRVCVMQGIIDLLNDDELRAVLGHELAHIKNRDVLTITMISVIPMVLYHLAWQMMYSRRRDRDGNSTALFGLIAFLFYFITNLLVLYGSRIREYYADRGSIEMGNKPASLASALYKLVYGSARLNSDQLHEAEGMKAFFANDPSRAYREIRELAQVDLDRSGTLDTSELMALRQKTVKMNFGDHLMELMSTHPNMLKRIQHLSQYTGSY